MSASVQRFALANRDGISSAVMQVELGLSGNHETGLLNSYLLAVRYVAPSHGSHRPGSATALQYAESSSESEYSRARRHPAR